MTRPRDILIFSNRVDPRRLDAVLREVGIEGHVAGDGARRNLVAGTVSFVEEGAPVPEGSDHIVLPAAFAGSLEVWIASSAARRLRRVPDFDACGSPGVEKVLEAGHWLHPDAPPLPADGSSGVLVVKPGIDATPAFVRELAQRAAECGYGVVEARTVMATEVRERRLARAHYRSHCDFAERGGLTPRERARLLRLYDTPEFERRHGCRARDVPVVPVELFLEKSGVPPDAIRRWSDATTASYGIDSGTLDGPNDLGDDKYVNLFVDFRWTGGRPVFLLNPHMPSVLAWWEGSRSRRVVFLLSRLSPHGLRWARLRADFCGVSDAARASPGSLRRDALEGILLVPVEDDERVNRTRNVVHLSNGPVEALRETALWFERSVEAQPAASALISAARVNSDVLLERTYLAVDGEVHSFTGITAGLTVAEAAERIARGRLLLADALICTPETARRLDAAHALIPDILRDGTATAIIVTGSTARNRASNDSDVDIVVVASSAIKHRTERLRVDGLLFECEWMDIERARWIARGGDLCDLKGLREASRIGTGIPLHDPDSLAGDLAAVARALMPSRVEVDGRLTPALESLDALMSGSDKPAFCDWETLREIEDNLAVVLLSLHPLRYQKPKWVLADLEEIGCGELVRALLRSYGAAVDDSASRETVRGALEILASIARSLQFPRFEDVMRRGFVDLFPGWSYACRCLADAQSLLRDGAPAAAAYTAKFAVRLALRVAADNTESGSCLNPEDHLEAPTAAYRRLFGAETSLSRPDDVDLEECVRWAQLVMEARKRAYRL